MEIKNVIFDVGNVLVRWAPYEVIASLLPQFNPLDFYQKMHPIWIELNLGKLSEAEAIEQYQKCFGLSKETLVCLMDELKFHQKPLPGSIELLNKLQRHKIQLFSITDNVKEIMAYHKNNSEFPKYFKDIIVSAEVGVLKPDPKIYQHLLIKQGLNAGESVFIDDVLLNIEGAINVDMKAFQFIDHVSCEQKLMSLLKLPVSEDFEQTI